MLITIVNSIDVKTLAPINYIHAYNITKNKVEFVIKDASKSKFLMPNFQNASVLNGKFYLMTTTSVVCLNLSAGKLEWENTLSNEGHIISLSGGQLLIAGGQIFVKGSENKLFALNPNTGNLNWQSTDEVDINSSPMAFAKNSLYFVSSLASTPYLIVVDANSGKIRHTYLDINHYSIYGKEPIPSFFYKLDFYIFSGSTPVIDEQNNLLYINDEYFSQCIELPN